MEISSLIPLHQLVLMTEKTFFQVGGTYITDTCDRIFTCEAHGLTESPFSCHAKATCESRNGERNCYCQEHYTGDGQNCQGSAYYIIAINVAYATNVCLIHAATFLYITEVSILRCCLSLSRNFMFFFHAFVIIIVVLHVENHFLV